MGLLPCSERINFRHVAEARSADRTLRARVRSVRPGSKGIFSSGAGSNGREPHRRRHCRRSNGHRTVPVSSDGPRLRDVGERCIPVLGINAPRRRCPRNVRISRSEVGNTAIETLERFSLSIGEIAGLRSFTRSLFSHERGKRQVRRMVASHPLAKWKLVAFFAGNMFPDGDRRTGLGCVVAGRLTVTIHKLLQHRI